MKQNDYKGRGKTMNSKITFDTIEELYRVTKTDRYTQDAYQVGEISRKTGLQKQSDGTWAPPKNGAPKGAKQIARIPEADHPKRRDSDILSNRDYTESNKAYAERSRQLHAKADKERAERNANAENKTSAIMQEAKERNLSGPQLKDFVFSKIWEGQNIDHVQSSMEAQDWSLTEADDGINVYEKADGSKVTMQLEGSKVKSVDYSAPGTKEAKPEKNPAPKTESVSSRRMQKDLDGNFWSRPEDFKEDITSRGWDVEEMNNEYAVISNEAGSQYEVRFDDHSDDGDLTVRTFKPLMIDEDDEDEGIEDAAPRKLTGDTKIRVRK